MITTELQYELIGYLLMVFGSMLILSIGYNIGRSVQAARTMPIRKSALAMPRYIERATKKPAPAKPKAVKRNRVVMVGLHPSLTVEKVAVLAESYGAELYSENGTLMLKPKTNDASIRRRTTDNPNHAA